MIESDYGPAAVFSVGKEWWLGQQVGVGLALQIQTSLLDVPSSNSSDLTSLTSLLALSATFN